MNANRLKRLTHLVAAAVLIAGASSVWADPLPVGGDISVSVVNNTGVSAGTTIIADTGWENSSTVEATGQVREVVASGDANNPYGGLDFIYQLHNTSPAASGINLAALNAFHFGSFLTDVLAANPHAPSFSNGGNSFGTPGPGGNDPTGAERTNNGGGVGNQVSFLYGVPAIGTLTPGSYSDVLIVRTNANAVLPGVIDFNDGGTSGQLNGYSPFDPNLRPVPEPPTLLIWGGALAGLWALGTWRRRQKVAPASNGSLGFAEAWQPIDASAKRR